MTFESKPVSYNGHWPELFRAEAEKIRTALPTTSIKIEHIGSTSIAGLSAKPILDFLIEVQSGALPSLQGPLVGLGYNSKGEFGIPGRSYFSRKGSSSQLGVHIHAFEKGHPALIKHIAFRDYLRAHPKVAQEYGSLKSQILSSPDVTRENYQERKQPFLEKVNTDALGWYSINSAVLKNVRKALLYGLRKSGPTVEILTFDQIKYPEVNPQIPSGTIEAGEDIYSGALRELHEESGIELKVRPTLLGSYTFYKDHLKQFQERFTFAFNGQGLPDTWIHKVTGSGVDQNLDFKYYWMPVEQAKNHLQVNLGDGLVFFNSEVKEFI